MGGLCSHSPLRVSFSRAALLARRILAQGFTCGQFDVIVSNCVVNLSPDKDAVLKGVHGLLKPGGEFYFSDVYADRRVPAAVRNDPVLYGECLGGALYWNDFLRLAMRQGFADPRLVEDRPLEITNPDLAQKTGGVGFHSATYRLFKLDGLESACEDYGQAVIDRGTVPGQPAAPARQAPRHREGARFPRMRNTWRMLHDTRFAAHVDFIGNFDRHFGLFEGCGEDLPFNRSNKTAGAGPCC